MLRKEILLHVSMQMRDAVDKQRVRAAKHPISEREMLVAVKVPHWLYRILIELSEQAEPCFYGVPVVVNHDNDEIEAMWWDPTMTLDMGIPI